MPRLFRRRQPSSDKYPILHLTDKMAPALVGLGLTLAVGCVSLEDDLPLEASTERSIVGGTNASISTHPWQVSLQGRSSSRSFCGGSILHPSWILTAAHCVDGASASSLEVLAGVSRLSQASVGQTRRVRRVITYPGYIDPTRGKDIALLELEAPLQLSNTVASIDIVRPADVDQGLTRAGVPAIITGWGTIRSGGRSPDTLQAATVPLVSTTDANRAYFNVSITSDQLAAGRLGQGGVDSCQGDSGGPLTVANSAGTLRKLAGIVSWGYGCGDPSFPGMYARVSSFADWVESFVPALSPVPMPGQADACEERSTAVTGMPVSIPDADPAGVRAQVQLAGRGRVVALEISLNIEHTYRGDLSLRLSSPSGSTLTLLERAGGSADNVVVADVSLPGFEGEPSAGIWTLVVSDNAAQDLGALRAWSLKVTRTCDIEPSQGWSASAAPNLPTVDEGRICSTVFVAEEGNAADAQLDLEGEHTWRAVLRATLEHEGTTVEAFPLNSFPRGRGTFSLSNEAIGGFSGTARGRWTLCLYDVDAYGDTGALQRWSVHD